MPKYKTPENNVKKNLRREGTFARKSLGQNFLVDDSLLPAIIEAAELGPGDTVLEIGPGLGMLTSQLVNHAGKVIAVEIDEKLAAALEKKYESRKNLTVINADILKVGLEEITGSASPYKVVANLPYNITSPVLNYFITAERKPLLMVIMIQKEVAEAITARPGNLSVLAIAIQLMAEPRIVKLVPPESFYPVPKVDSAILRLDLREKPAIMVDDSARFIRFVKKSFHSPRKTINNSLQRGLNMAPEESKVLLQNANLNPGKRPGELGLSEWGALYEESKKMGAAPD